MKNDVACLTTHVLDTSHGCPGADIQIMLYALGENAARTLLKRLRTNDDGRCDQPLLTAENWKNGVYELEFYVGDYFRARGVVLPQPPFVDVVSLRFGISSPTHYHVPLLVSPWSYSTYRGS